MRIIFFINEQCIYTEYFSVGSNYLCSKHICSITLLAIGIETLSIIILPCSITITIDLCNCLVIIGLFNTIQYLINIYIILLFIDSCSVSALSLGLRDIGCGTTNKADCVILTLNDVEFRPFEQLSSDGLQQGLAMMILDKASCSVVSIF